MKRVVVLLVLTCCSLSTAHAQGWRDLVNKAKDKAKQAAGIGDATSTAARNVQTARGLPTGEDRQIEAEKRNYDMLVAHGNERAAAAYAVIIGKKYERKADYPSAADWYRTGYAKGNMEGSTGFIDLVLLNKITIDNPQTIRPFVEIRALCGSHIARTYVLDHWQETPQQIQEYPADQKFTECGPVGPGDQMEGNLWQQRQVAQRQREVAQQQAEYYRQHPDQDPNVEAQKAAEGAAILLGALLIQGASMPATGPGSIACNRYQNHYPGAYDPSVCNVPPSK